jgi:polysaccharide biosynthesis transport protein
MALGDIYYVLFRHKWKVILLSLAGFVAAGLFYVLRPPPYISQAEVLIQYVEQAGAMPLLGSDQKVIVPNARGEDVINSEIQIMTSLDLAAAAVTNLGASRILAKYGGGSNDMNAAVLIQRNLQAEPASKGSSVIVVTFKHPDPQIVQPVLQEVINDYFQKHREIHSIGGQFDDVLNRERTSLSVQLNDTEQQIAALQNQNNILSLEDSRKSLADQISKIQSAILDAKAELTGYEAVFKQTPVAQTENSPATNAAPVVIPSDQMDNYRSICARLDALRKKQQDYLIQGFTSSNSLVEEVGAQIAVTQQARDELLKTYPQIADSGNAQLASHASPSTVGLDLRDQALQAAALRAKIGAWASQLEQLQLQATNLNNLAPKISQLEQTKAIQEANYHNLATGIEKSHLDQALDTGKAPNIKWVQYPSPPARDWRKTYKAVGMLAFGGVFAGLALAFLIEFLLDRSFRRPVEIESRLKVPLFLSIPDVRRNGHLSASGIEARRQLQSTRPSKFLSEATNGKQTDHAANGKSSLPVVSLERNPALHPFCEALRDRLIVYFEVHKLTHKPKLVAVTSAGRGTGVSTLAAGLAASLSETGDGNVLLVDMNVEQGAAQQFYHGNACCGLDEALNSDTKQNALVQDNLYVVNGNVNSEELPRILPKRFSSLVPKLKASDYDYIIFDMPAVTQTSLTSRLARFMDMVLLVVESEKSDREVVQQANHWLTESGATVGAVLNKTRQYVPASLHKEFLSD